MEGSVSFQSSAARLLRYGSEVTGSHLPVVVDAVILRPRAVAWQLGRVGVAVPLVRAASDGIAYESAQPLRVLVLISCQCVWVCTLRVMRHDGNDPAPPTAPTCC